MPEMVLRTGPGIARSPNDYREVVLDTAALTAFVNLCNKHNVAQWHGFHKNAPDVLDGMGFSFALTLAAGTKISAGGENAFPKGYRVITSSIIEFFKQYVSE